MTNVDNDDVFSAMESALHKVCPISYAHDGTVYLSLEAYEKMNGSPFFDDPSYQRRGLVRIHKGVAEFLPANDDE